MVSWGVGWLDNDTPQRALSQNPELIHLHWVCKGFISIRGLADLSTPIVWTLHDMWAFTGGCHYSEDCTRYTDACGLCPQLRSRREGDLTRRIWNLKKRHWENLNLTFVTPSRWLSDCVKASSLLHSYPVKVIPNGIDTAVFAPHNREVARQNFGLVPDRKIILTGALKGLSDERKGFQLLAPALKRLVEGNLGDDVELVVYGQKAPARPPYMGLRTTFAGEINNDDELAILYSAADVFVAPSKQENLANTVMEAMACGTPVVAFNIGGMPDMIEHKVTGYLAQPFDIQDLARGISWVIQHNSPNRSLSDRARAKVENEYAHDKVGLRHALLYEDVLRRSNP